jgi:hypothetical protein
MRRCDGLRLSRAIRPLVICLVSLGFENGAVAGPPHMRGGPAAIRHFESAEHILVRRSGPLGTARASRATSVSFRSLGRQFDLDIEASNLMTRAHRTVWIGGNREDEDVPVDFLYRGRVRGEPESWVRLSIRNGRVDGMIWTPTETYFIQPEARLLNDPTTNQMVVYRMSDVDPSVLHGACGAADLQGPSTGQSVAQAESAGADAVPLLAQAVAPAVAEATAPLQQATIGLVADYDYFMNHGANAAADMLSIINQVAGVFQAEAGVDLQVTQTVVYTTTPDPFDDTTDPTTLLTEFSNYKGTSGSPVFGTDLAHLFTGRTLNNSVLGVAWIGTLCDSTYSTGLSTDFTTDNTSLVLLTAHEIGHIFGAYHDNQAGSPCASVPFGFIMNPYVSSALSLDFSGCSLSLMDPEIAGASCLSPAVLPSASPTPSPTATPSPTRTVQPTPTQTPTSLPTNTRTPTPTNTKTPIPTSTKTPTPVSGLFWFWSRFFTPTPAVAHTNTATPTPGKTATPVPAKTATPTPTSVARVATPTPSTWWGIFARYYYSGR